MDKYPNVKSAIKALNSLLDEKGKKVFNRRTKKETLEVVGVSFTMSSESIKHRVNPRALNDLEIYTAFKGAEAHLAIDGTARFAVGRPKCQINKKLVMPCICLVQVLLREPEIYVIVYFRSMDIKEAEKDILNVLSIACLMFGKAKVIFHIGSLHKYL